MSILLHGTTQALRLQNRSGTTRCAFQGAGRSRHERRIRDLPQGRTRPAHSGISRGLCVRQSRAISHEGGPAILEIDCPDDIIAATDQLLYPASQGIIQFDEGSGLENLLAVWRQLEKRIVIFDPRLLGVAPMNTTSELSELSEAVRKAFTPSPRGVVGVIDDLLASPWEHCLEMDWKADHCRVRLGRDGSAGGLELPFASLIFARSWRGVAVLCNERNPGSVSPYGGEGELLAGANPAKAVRVKFTNTPDKQTLC